MSIFHEKINLLKLFKFIKFIKTIKTIKLFINLFKLLVFNIKNLINKSFLSNAMDFYGIR
jgi:hypothetical protein